MVMEFCDGGDLETLVEKKKKENEKFTEDVSLSYYYFSCDYHVFFALKEILKITQHVFMGLQAMHGMKVIHRDIKLANILIDKDGNYKLGVIFLFVWLFIC
jgi:serine/threonine protein kinase